MKKAILVTVFLFFCFSGHAQVLISLLLGDKLNSDKLEFGLDGGLNRANIRGLDQSTSVGRFNIGFYFDFKLKNPAWMVHTGVIVKSTMGAQDIPVYDLNDANLNAALSGGSVDRRLSYFNVPILIKRQFKSHFFAEAGPMLGLMNKSVDVFTKEIKDEDDLSYTLKIRDNYHPLDAGLMLGLGYRLLGGNGMNLGVRYYYGLVDVTIDDVTPDEFNRSLYFSVGIPIGKAPKSKEE